jgi:hypothetical protein
MNNYKQQLRRKQRELRDLRLEICTHDPHEAESTCPGAALDQALKCLNTAILDLDQEENDAE